MPPNKARKNLAKPKGKGFTKNISRPLTPDGGEGAGPAHEQADLHSDEIINILARSQAHPSQSLDHFDHPVFVSPPASPSSPSPIAVDVTYIVDQAHTMEPAKPSSPRYNPVILPLSSPSEERERPTRVIGQSQSSRCRSIPRSSRSVSPAPTQRRSASPDPFDPTPVLAWTRHTIWGRISVISLVVEDTLYDVPARMLQQSNYFMTHCADSEPKIVNDVTIFEMDSLLSVLDAGAIGNVLDDLSSDQWTAVLRLATKWGFTAVREHAINIFDTRFRDQETFSRIDLARRCKVAKWFPPAYRQLCERPESLTLVEVKKLGLPQFVAISRIRDELRRARLEDVVRIVDGRLDDEEVSLSGRCTGCRMRVAVNGKPYEGMGLCRAKIGKGSVELTTQVADMVADAEELRVAF